MYSFRLYLCLQTNNNILFIFRFTQITVDEMTIDDLVCIDTKKSLMPLLLANSQYEVSVGKSGSKHKIVYRFAALEKQVTSLLLFCEKPLHFTSQLSYYILM